jgi:hypothetical protein
MLGVIRHLTNCGALLGPFDAVLSVDQVTRISVYSGSVWGLRAWLASGMRVMKTRWLNWIP